MTANAVTPPAMTPSVSAGGHGVRRVDGARLQRLLARFVGVGFLGFLAVCLPEFATTATLVAPWWTPVAALIVFAPGGALLLSTFRSHDRWTHACALSAATGYLAANALWLLAWNGQTVDGLRSNWLVMFAGLAGMSAALALSWGWAMLVQVGASVVSALTNQMGLANRSGMPGEASLAIRVGTEALWSVAVSGVFVAALLIGIRTARMIDRTRGNVEVATASAAADDARNRERARLDAMVHDQILAVLLDVGRGPVVDRTRRHARLALDELDSATGDCADVGSVGPAAVIDRLRAVVGRIDDRMTISAEVSADAAADRYPPQVVAEISAATAEALRNSIIHAGEGVHRAVLVAIGSDRVDVSVVDLGSGFDTGSDGGRLGIALSIDDRMRRLRGGWSSVRSRPGVGTVVDIGWHR